jgi:glycosyltransferase involved in cell wall biosynthesis
MDILFVNFPSQTLLDELQGYGCKAVNLEEDASELRFGRLISRLSSSFDVVYYTKFVSRGLEDLPPYISALQCRSVLGFHTPVLIDHPERTIYKLYNVVNSGRLMAHKCIRVFDAFHSLNSSDHALLSMLGFRSYLVPMGYDEMLFTPCEKSQEEFRVLFSGSLYHKGVDIAANLAYTLARKHNDMRFVFVDGARSSFIDNALGYREYLGNSGIGNITSLDELRQEEFARLLGQSHLLLFSSRWESFGRVVVEALGSGCPVVCFDIPGPPSSLMRRFGVGHVARPFDPIDLAGGLLAFYNLWKKRPEEYLELSKRCRSVSLMFSWRRLAAKYFEMFKAVTTLGNPRS